MDFTVTYIMISDDIRLITSSPAEMEVVMLETQQKIATKGLIINLPVQDLHDPSVAAGVQNAGLAHVEAGHGRDRKQRAPCYDSWMTPPRV